jgi:hypothetical protein
MGEREQSSRPRGQEARVALRPATVEVDGQVGPVELGREWRERGRRHELVDRSAEARELSQCGRGCEQAAVAGERGGERPQRRNGREQIAQARAPEGR